LNQADLVLAVSHGVADLYRKLGVARERLAVCHIGTTIATSTPLARHRPLPEAGDVVDVVFLGLAARMKGLPLLLDALASTPDSTLSRVRLCVYVRGLEEVRNTLTRLAPRLAGLTTRDGYRHDELAALLRDADVGVVPPIWQDTAPQVVFEMLAMGVPVIGARIGGIPDFIRDGVNGLLFEPSNATDLAERLCSVVEAPQRLRALRAGIRPLKTLATHVDELESFYRGEP
jgi:glycosyltransferase involved in cell wall biosynthesis